MQSVPAAGFLQQPLEKIQPIWPAKESQMRLVVYDVGLHARMLAGPDIGEVCQQQVDCFWQRCQEISLQKLYPVEYLVTLAIHVCHFQGCR